MKQPTDSGFKMGDKVFSCPVGLASNVINGKWKLQIMHQLSVSSTLRFGALKKKISDVSEKMLIQHLKELENDGIIIRKVYPVVPPRVEYELSPNGKAFKPVIDAMRIWGTLLSEKNGNHETQHPMITCFKPKPK